MATGALVIERISLSNGAKSSRSADFIIKLVKGASAASDKWPPMLRLPANASSMTFGEGPGFHYQTGLESHSDQHGRAKDPAG